MKAQILIILTSILLDSTPLEEIQNKWMTLKPDGTRWNLTDLGKLCAEYRPETIVKTAWLRLDGGWVAFHHIPRRIYSGEGSITGTTVVTTKWVCDEKGVQHWISQHVEIDAKMVSDVVFRTRTPVEPKTPPPIQPVVDPNSIIYDPNDTGLKLLRELLKERP